ncbi:MAG: restriction endonuclease [Robiginitomaculum sp.]|nr:MAG: restriction endonuclease [Robiginitomaculum sp.]
MTRQAFRKTLSANDTGQTKSHQAGMLIPKGDQEFRDFLGTLDPGIKNPRRTILCLDESDEKLELQYIYYNNRLHDERGTRNEYRLTCLTGYLRQNGARAGDEIEISKDDEEPLFRIAFVPQAHALPAKIILRGWRRVH